MTKCLQLGVVECGGRRRERQWRRGLSDTRLWLRQKERYMTCIGAARGRFLVEFLEVQCRAAAGRHFHQRQTGKKTTRLRRFGAEKGADEMFRPSGLRIGGCGLGRGKEMLDREAMPTMKRISEPGVTLRIVKKIPALALGIRTTLPPGRAYIDASSDRDNRM